MINLFKDLNINQYVRPQGALGLTACLLAFFMYSGVSNGQENSNEIKIVYDSLEVADTAKVHFFNLEESTKHFLESKENYIDDDFFDPSRGQGRPFVHTGNLGSPAQSLTLDPNFSIDRFVLENPMEVYNYNAEGFKFLSSPVDYSRVSYNQAFSAQADLIVRATALKNWSENLSMTIHFTRISQAEGQYIYQTTRNTALGIGFLYHSKSKKYKLNGLYVRNKNQQQYNWGINQNDNFPLQRNENDLNLDAFSTSAEGLNYENVLSLNHELLLFKPDSSRIFNGLVHLETKYSNTLLHYFDDEPQNLSDFGLLDPYDVDSKQIRYWYQVKALENSAGLGLKVLRNHTLKISLSNIQYWIDNDLEVRRDQETRIRAAAKGKMGDKGQYTGRLEIPVLNNLGRLNLMFDADPKILSNGLNLKLAYRFTKMPPDLIARDMVVSQREIDLGTYRDPVNQKVGVKLSWQDWVNLEFNYFNFTDPILFDETLALTQFNGNFSAWEISPSMDVDLWRFNLKAQVWVQSLPSFYRLPELISEADISYNQRLFDKKLHLQFGSQIRYFDSYQPYRFVPTFGQFALQNNFFSPDYPLVDAYLGIRVSSLRIQLRMDNILPLLDDSLRLSELVYRHPQFYGYFRLGLSWTFFN